MTGGNSRSGEVPATRSARRGERRPQHRGRWLLAAYLVLLLASHLVRRYRAPDPVPDGLGQALVRSISGRTVTAGTVRITFREWGSPDSPAVVLLHGSPGSSGVMHGLGDILGARFHVIAPDLPGFGHSIGRIPDYSVEAHAAYVGELLDSLGIARAHVVGFSMGGGVAIEMIDQDRARVRSLTLLSAIGVQELELLGDYHLNHAIHGLQLAGLWFLYEAVPNFGVLDRNWLDVAYARNFYDTDQRPLRNILARYDGPALILHGDHDPLVPPAAAREHYRIVPQAEMVMFPGDHFMTFMRPTIISAPLERFFDQVDRGAAPTRSEATAERVAAAQAPFDPTIVPTKEGFSLSIVLFLICVATLVSEDLATISAGLLVARGSITFMQATSAALLGIFVGDMLLFLAGRLLGAPALERAPLKWIVHPADVERSRQWFARRGPLLVLASRFIPGTRLPTYVAAGALRMNFFTFSLWFLLASFLWTPLLVSASMVFGTELSRLLGPDAPSVWPWLLGVGAFLVAVRLALRSTTYRGRRLLLARWRRLTEWEFWPVGLFYLPVGLYIIYLGLKHRSLTLFTAANPALPDGGFAGESKASILRGLPREPVARFDLLPTGLPPADRLERVRHFMERDRLDFPIVAKPDVGERGAGVAVVNDEDELRGYLEGAGGDTLIQEYVPGVEVGVYYYRLPDEPRGRIFGITEKRLQSVTGDGSSTLETLILRDERAMRQAGLFLERHSHNLLDVPAAGTTVPLGRLGNHCQGAVFLDGRRLLTRELEDAVDRISRQYDGFYVGRYDIRAPTEDDLMAGRNLTVLELNGVSSEATNIYDPANSLGNAYRTLFEQWRIVFAIAAANRRRGVRPLPLGEFARGIWHYLSRSRSTPAHANPATGTFPEAATLSD